MGRRKIMVGVAAALALVLAVGYILILPVYVKGETLPAVRIDAETGAVETTQLRLQGDWITRRWGMEPPRFHGVISTAEDPEGPDTSRQINFIALGEDHVVGFIDLEREDLTIHAAKDLQSFFCEAIPQGGGRVSGYIVAPAQTLEEAKPIVAALGLGFKLP